MSTWVSVWVAKTSKDASDKTTPSSRGSYHATDTAYRRRVALSPVAESKKEASYQLRNIKSDFDKKI